MRFEIDKTKAAIKNQSIFNGLVCDDVPGYCKTFLAKSYYLVKCYDDKRFLGYVIYELRDRQFIFSLVNFTQAKTSRMTEIFVNKFVLPLARHLGLAEVHASVERPGMATKLKRLGFGAVGDIYVRAV